MAKTNVKNDVLNALKGGRNITKATLETRFGKNISSTIKTLRTEGFAIYTNNVDGKVAYRLGAPTREVVAAGYAALAKTNPFGK